MKKNYLIIGAGLVLVYLFLKKQKKSVPEDVKSVDQKIAVEVMQDEIQQPLLISPSVQQQINQYTPGMNDNGQNVTVRYIAGSKKHYI